MPMHNSVQRKPRVLRQDSVQSSLRSEYLGNGDRRTSVAALVVDASVESLDRVEAIQRSASPFAARNSSLPNSPEYVPFKGALPPSLPPSSVADRLSRPTRASQARAAESKTQLLARGRTSAGAGTAVLGKSIPPAQQVVRRSLPSMSMSSSKTSVKNGLKNRFSAILNGHRRNTVIPSASEPLINKRNRQSMVDNTSVHRTRHGSSLAIPARNHSGRNQRRKFPAENGHQRMRTSSQLQQEQSPAGSDALPASQSEPTLSDSQETPTSRTGPTLVYSTEPSTSPGANTSSLSIDVEELRQSQISDNDIGEELADYLHAAIRNYMAIAEVANGTTDPAARQAITAVLQPMSDAIRATNNARIAGIAFNQAITQIATFTVSSVNVLTALTNVPSTVNMVHPATRRPGRQSGQRPNSGRH